jgi:hypothetical protein
MNPKIYAGKNKGRTFVTYVAEGRAGGIIMKSKKPLKKDVMETLGIRRL